MGNSQDVRERMPGSIEMMDCTGLVKKTCSAVQIKSKLFRQNAKQEMYGESIWLGGERSRGCSAR